MMIMQSVLPRHYVVALAHLMTVLTVLAAGFTSQPLHAAEKRPLTIDDVLGLEHLDRATLSPNGAWVAAVVRRGARAGEVYGRTSYDVDPGRGDVWLISAKTGVRRAITHGAAKAAGYWCATWSPDGQRLAMLSTAPEGKEPRGGNNIRLYMWDRLSNAVSRVSNAAVMTQTRYGGALDTLDLRGGADRGTTAHPCSVGQAAEKAPFLWLDNQRLLVVTLPKGEVSAAIDQYERTFRMVARDRTRLHQGTEPTVRVVASGDARSDDDGGAARAILQIVNVKTHRETTVAAVPAYPFRVGLTASVSPDGKKLAVLATTGALRPQAGKLFPNQMDDVWTVKRRLGFADLTNENAFRWATMPIGARYPFDFLGWSPDGQSVALRARVDPFDDATPIFVADASRGTVKPAGSLSPEASKDRNQSHPTAAVWVDDQRLAVRAADGTWSLASANGTRSVIAMPAGISLPDRLTRAGDGSLIALAGKALFRLDVPKAAMIHVTDFDGDASFMLPEDPDAPFSHRLVLLHNNGGYRLSVIDTVSGAIGQSIPAIPGRLIDTVLASGTILYGDDGRDGIQLRAASLVDGSHRDLLSLDSSLRSIDWGERRVIAYKDARGADRNAAVILPPRYQPGRRYPTLVLVYGGYSVEPDLRDDFLTDPLMLGMYNLYLYAAKGYVVLVPSVPLGDAEGRRDIYAQVPTGVIPAIDKLVALGIADPDRVGVFGQSFGGYSVYALVTQTDRFKAAVAIAGLTDLAVLYGQFDPTARGYPGIEHEKSGNWAQTGQFGLQDPPWKDPKGYASSSPLSYAGRVHTPLLLIHGDADSRGASTQAELFFYSLYIQGKTAELALYGGESHNLAQSPANVRDAFERTVDWFDRWLREAGR